MLASCAPIRDRRTLNDMEALMPERPDSALAVLRGLQPRDLPGLHVRPLHALLLSEAFDKNYIDLTDDSLALAANHYYGDHGTKLHRLKSWYYLGRIRFNAGNYAEAVICYNKALEFAKALTNYHYIGLANREIANAYSEAWDDLHAIDFMQKSIDAFENAGDERYCAYSKLSLAKLLLRQSRFEDCAVVLNDIPCSPTEDQYLYSSVSELKAQVALSTGCTDYHQILADISSSEEGGILPQTAARLSRKAYVFQLIGDEDSSDYYLDKAYQTALSRGDSLVVGYDRFLIEDARGNTENAKKQLEQVLHMQDSSVYAALKQSISFYQGNYYQNESRVNALKAKMRALLYSIIIVLLSFLIAYLLSRNSKQRAMIVEEMARTSEIRRDIFALKDEKQEMGRMVATLFENRLNILQTLSEQYDLVDESHQRKMREKGRELSRDEIVSSFRVIMLELRKDKEINVSMEEALNVWKDGIMRRFRSIFGADSPSKIRMSEEDFELVPYYFSGMKQKTISYLTGCTEHAIKERKHRIKQKIEALDDSFSKEKELFLSNL